MAKESKKTVRQAFRNACFIRDKFSCAVCGMKSSPKKAEEDLDAHHILPRETMPNGGYVSENGISLCKKPDGCHEKAEEFYRTGTAVPGYRPDDLFKKIGSNAELATEASANLT